MIYYMYKKIDTNTHNPYELDKIIKSIGNLTRMEKKLRLQSIKPFYLIINIFYLYNFSIASEQDSEIFFKFQFIKQIELNRPKQMHIHVEI